MGKLCLSAVSGVGLALSEQVLSLVLWPLKGHIWGAH